jgi:CobW/HypB/UreG, nucleotide-binding domain
MSRTRAAAALPNVIVHRRRQPEPATTLQPTEPSSLIPVTLLTGFLGSGKTTVLNHVLKQPEMAATAVIVNEFGDIGLDHLLYQSFHYP